MAITAPGTPAPSEKPDPEAAKQGGTGDDRPGFDLGGAKEAGKGTGAGSSVPMGNPGEPAMPGTQAAGSGGAAGMTDGDRAVGGPAGGLKPGEARQGTAGAVRPPQSTSADQTFEQGNPDDAT